MRLRWTIFTPPASPISTISESNGGQSFLQQRMKLRREVVSLLRVNSGDVVHLHKFNLQHPVLLLCIVHSHVHASLMDVRTGHVELNCFLLVVHLEPLQIEHVSQMHDSCGGAGCQILLSRSLPDEGAQRSLVKSERNLTRPQVFRSAAVS